MISISNSLAEKLIVLLPQLTPKSGELTKRLETQRQVDRALRELKKKIKADVPKGD